MIGKLALVILGIIGVSACSVDTVETGCGPSIHQVADSVSKAKAAYIAGDFRAYNLWYDDASRIVVRKPACFTVEDVAIATQTVNNIGY